MSTLVKVLAMALLVTACAPTEQGNLSSKKRGGGTDEDPGAQTTDPKSGATVPPVVGGPGDALPAEPGGYQLTVAPLMEKSGCTECHHIGRTINLLSYPFMAGSSTETASRLAASIGGSGTMPPSPRGKADPALLAAITTWQSNGGKP